MGKKKEDPPSMEDMALEDEDPKERRRKEEEELKADVADMGLGEEEDSAGDLLNQQIKKASDSASVGDLSKEIQEKLGGEPENYSWDKKRVSDLTPEEILEVKKIFKLGGLKIE